MSEQETTGDLNSLPDFDGRYTNVSLLAQRGLTAALTATDSRTDQRVFIKILSEAKRDDPVAHRFFTNEPVMLQMLARQLPRLPLVPVLETGQWQGRPYFVQPFLSGWSLDKVLRKHPIFNGMSTLRVIEGCLEFLEQLNAAGVVHGDISPDNIFIETDAPAPEEGCMPERFTIRLIDFNSARRIAQPDSRTRTRNVIFLKLPYAAPELIQGQPLTAQSDIYSLGVLFHEMLAGERPFEPKTLEEIAHLAEADIPPLPFYLGVPQAVEELMRQMLSTRPEERPRSAGECLAVVRRFLSLHEWLSNTCAPEVPDFYLRTNAPRTDDRSVTFFGEPASEPLITARAARLGPPPITESVNLPSEVPQGRRKTTKQALYTLRGVGSERGRRWPLYEGKELTIGRAPANNVVVNDPRVSRFQAVIRFSERGGAEIEHKGANPTTVNGWSVPRGGTHPLLHGDQITIGLSEFEFLEGQLEAEESFGKREVQERYDRSLVSQEVSLAFDVPIPTREHESEMVNFSAFAPSVISPGASFILDVWAYLHRQRDEMFERATRPNKLSDRTWRRPPDAAERTELTLALRLDRFEVAESQASFFWCGEVTNVPFIVHVPRHFSPGIYPGRIDILHGGLLLSRLVIELAVGQGVEAQRNLETRQEHFKSAFASYAHEDQSEVLRRVQGIRAAGIEVFLDTYSLRAGEYWEEQIKNQIRSKDIFYLFWSVAASKSSWVSKEWHCALEVKGLDYIQPIPLVDPRLAPPPPELANKHFNDMILAYLNDRPSLRDI